MNYAERLLPASGLRLQFELMRRAALMALAALLAACSHPATPQEHFSGLYRQLHPSVVFLSMRAPSDDPKMHGKLDDAYGTGLVVESGDWGSRILTAEHVIEGGRNLRARIGDSRQTLSVRPIAQDKDQDLALLEAPSA